MAELICEIPNPGRALSAYFLKYTQFYIHLVVLTEQQEAAVC